MSDPSIRVNNVDLVPGLYAFATFFSMWVASDWCVSQQSVISSFCFLFLTAYFLQWIYMQRFNFGRAAARAHFDELNLLQLPRTVGMTFDCCAALEPPTMWIAPRKDDAANIDVPDLDKEEPLLGSAKKCTCKAAHAHKEKVAVAEPPASSSKAAVIINEPKCFPEQTEEQRREFERKRDAHYANEAIIAQKILRNEMTPEEAQAMLGISNPWAEEEKKKKQKTSGKKSGKKKSALKKKKAKEKQSS